MATTPFRSHSLSSSSVSTSLTASASTRLATPGVFNLSRKDRPIRKIDLLMLTTQLGIMTRSGLDLADTIRQLASRAQRLDLQHTLERLHADLEEGSSFSAALHRQRHRFGSSFVAAIAAGEASGKIQEVLDRQKVLLRSEVRIRSTIMGSLAYPLFLTFVSIAVVLALVFFVLPQFEIVFQNMGVPAPLFTRVIIQVASFAKSNWLIELFVFGFLLIGIVQLARLSSFRPIVDKFALHMPFVRKSVRYLATGRLFRTMGTMIQSGVPVLESIRLSQKTVRNSRFLTLLNEMEESILAGDQIATPISKADFLPDGTSEMLATAERTGELGSVLQLVGEFYEEEGERSLKDLVRLVEPMIIIFAGFVVAIIVASIMLPLFDLSSTPA